jgi:hypothetical protein
VESEHHKRMLNPITSVGIPENRRLIERGCEFIDGDSFITRPANHERIKAILDFYRVGKFEGLGWLFQL